MIMAERVALHDGYTQVSMKVSLTGRLTTKSFALWAKQ